MAMLGIGKDSVCKYFNLVEEGGVLETPGKVRKREAPLRTIGEEKKNRINEIIFNACDQRKYHTTITS